jgi:membrane associated rhomboid family serine protease
VFNAPLVAVGVAVSMPVLFWFQLRLPDVGQSLAFRPSSLWDGGWWPDLLTSIFIHGNWPHAGMNAALALAFGAPVARLMIGLKGAAGFLAFYIVCGLLAGVGYAMVHPALYEDVGGASGAVFGLMGAALRLLGRKSGKLRRLTDKRFLIPAAAVMAVNAALGLLGVAPGMEGMKIAWEAHAFGFVAGALLAGPWVSVFRARPEAFDSPPDLRDPEA